MSVDFTDLLESKSSGKGGKKITPGNHVLKITGLTTKEDERYPEKKYIYINVETEPIDDFEGFYIDNDPSKGRHLGKIGKINAKQCLVVNQLLNKDQCLCLLLIYVRLLVLLNGLKNKTINIQLLNL
jgi:hypothetical protein